MKLDLLCFGAHPDDVEISCAGTVLKHLSIGKKIGIVDLTKGELGTRGNAELRLKEAQNAAKILGVSVRDNLEMADGFFQNDKEHQLKVIQKIRQYHPEIVLCNAVKDRHPDHGRASQLVSEACFLSGLRKLETTLNDIPQNTWRPKAIYHYIQYYQLKPDILIDISDFMSLKMEALEAFQSQFYDPNSKEPETILSSPVFLNTIQERASDLGKMIGVKYAEGFTAERYIGVSSLFDLIISSPPKAGLLRSTR